MAYVSVLTGAPDRDSGAQEAGYFWLDVLVVSQHESAQKEARPQDWWSTTFKEAVRTGQSFPHTPHVDFQPWLHERESLCAAGSYRQTYDYKLRTAEPSPAV